MTQGVSLTTEELRKLLSCGCPDAALLYLYCKAELPRETALDALHFTVPRMVAATDCLKQLGLWQDQAPRHVQPETPRYTEEELRKRLREDKGEFSKLIGEAQRRLGRTLSTEELKTLLAFTDYLRLPTEVVGILLSYCVERSRRRGMRAPSMRMIEKEAYRWADENIDTLEAASFYVQNQLAMHTRVQQLRLLMQIDQRRLTQTEEQYLGTWVAMGFPNESILMAYERTCLKTGGLKWNYMNSILRSWNEKNLHTPQEILQGDSAPAHPQVSQLPQRRENAAFRRHGDPLSDLERQAVERALAEGKEG